MTWKLWLDDIRQVPDSTWTCAHTVTQAQNLIKKYGVPDSISFDHDLGEGLTGYDFAKWLCIKDDNKECIIPDDFTYTVHSANPVGAKNIQMYMDTYLKYFK